MIKAVLHLDRYEGGDRAGLGLALQYIRQLRFVDAQAAVVLVATDDGVAGLREDDFERTREVIRWEQLGIIFAACELSLRARNENLETYRFLPGVRPVPCGIAYALELQGQGYGYIKV